MAENIFIVICTDEEGAVTIEGMTKKLLLERLANNHWGNIEELQHTLTTCGDPTYWGNTLTVIKGRVVVPTIKKVVEEYELG